MSTPIDFRTYLVLEATLVKRLRKAWNPIVAKYHAGIVAALDVGDVGLAYERAKDLDTSPIGEGNREFIKYVLLSCAVFGAKVVSRSRDTVVQAGNHEDLMNKVTDGLIHALEYNLTLDVVGSAMHMIALNQLGPNVVQKLEPHEYVKDFVTFARSGDKMLQLIASLHSSRLSTWGFVAEAEILGVTEYKVTAVLDGRTSDFCRMINGKVFQVQDARTTVNQVLGLDNPDDIRTVQKWPNQSKASIKEFESYTPEQFVAQNLHIPPYHPMCRTLLTSAVKPPRLEKPKELAGMVNEQAPPISPYTATSETFEELGVDLGDDEVQHWNDYMGINPVEVLGKLSGADKLDILSNALGGNYRKIVIDAKGNIKFQMKVPVGEGKATVGATYDPYNGQMYQNSLVLNNVAPKDATNYLKGVYLGMLDVVATVGADSLAVASAGASAAVTYAQAGFLPSPVAWFKLKTKLLSRIESGDLKFLYDNLGTEQYAALLDILNSKDEKGFFALTALPFTVMGAPIWELLLEGVKLDLSLDTSTPTATAQAKDAFK